MSKRRLLPVAWLLLLLSLPAVLWIFGDRQPLLESRPKEEFPALNRSTLGNPETFRRIDTALLDRLPLRGRALDLRARLAVDLFRDSSSPDVAIGHDGYLYYVPDLLPCRPGGEPIADAADAVDVLARTLVTSGRTTAVVVPRSKLFMHPDDAPEIDAAAERCLQALEERVDARLASVPGGLTFTARQQALEQAGEATFLLRDTHWNWRGRELFARAVLDRIRPGLADEAGLRAGDELQRPGDLDKFLGRSRTETDRTLEALRTPLAPAPAGDVVLVGDSQLEQTFAAPLGDAPPLIERTLPGAVYCNWSMVQAGDCTEPLRRARTVVIEKVARELQLLTQLCWVPLSTAAEQLRGRPARWERVDGGELADPRALELPAGGVRVRVRAAGADVSDRPRLLRLPLATVPAGADGAQQPVTLTQQPQAGPPAPCATPAAAAGGALIVPVPAGRRVSDLVMQLDGPAGALLGAPEEIALDGRQAG